MRGNQAPFMTKEFRKAIYKIEVDWETSFVKCQVKKMKNYTRNKEISVAQSVKKYSKLFQQNS